MIGMLDSGVGGFSVLREIRALLPHESILYVADEGHLPYGPRSRDEIRSFVVGIAQFLRDRGCSILVIACNAANAAALHYLRGQMPDIPIVGMEPAIKPAAEHTRTRAIGVLTTRASYQSELYASVIDRFAANLRVESRVCPDFVLLVERGAPHDDLSRRIIAENLASLKQSDVDQVVLACTHFPFLTDQIADFLGPGVTIIDPAPAVARQVKRVMEDRALRTHSSSLGTACYYTSDEPDHVAARLRDLLGEESAAVYAAHWQGTRLLDDAAGF